MSTLPLTDRFHIPDGLIYMDGNSLGPVLKGTVEHAQSVMQDQWGEQLIRAWNTAGWMTLPNRVGDKIAHLIGASNGSVSTGDTLSIKVYQAVSAALQMRPNRKVILSDTGNFPTDLYITQGLLHTLDQNYELRLCKPHEIEQSINSDVAAVLLTHVDYRTGRMYDMKQMTAAAHEAGAVMIWDLAHSVGAMSLALGHCNAEFAVGCTYKYLNGGPGAPAFIYTRPDLIESVRPALSGWMGHEAPFAMDLDYRPGQGSERLRIGTPAVMQLSVLDYALRVWDDVDLNDLRRESMRLSSLFIELVETSCPQLKLASPRDPERRGSHVSFSFEQGYAVVQALIDRGLIGDFRAPDIMRFGITPLYLSQNDIVQAAGLIKEVMATDAWNDPKYAVRSAVT